MHHTHIESGTEIEGERGRPEYEKITDSITHNY